MRRFLITCVMSVWLMPCGVYAQDPPAESLFLTQQEAQTLDGIRGNSTQHRVHDPADLRLDAIIFYAPDRWTLWLNDEKWTPETTRRGVKILAVSAHDVRLSYRASLLYPAREITLRPHQTYQAVTETVVPTPY